MTTCQILYLRLYQSHHIHNSISESSNSITKDLDIERQVILGSNLKRQMETIYVVHIYVTSQCIDYHFPNRNSYIPLQISMTLILTILGSCHLAA
jgi:hypothetical protein